MSPISPNPELVLRPALCLLGMPLGIGMPDFSRVSRLANGVATLLPSLLLPVSSRNKVDNGCTGPRPLEVPLIELRGRVSLPSTPLIEAEE